MSPCFRALCAAALVLVPGTACAIHPRGEREERERALEAGRAFEPPAEPAPLPDEPSAQDYLRRAFFASASLHQRYWEWRAALERIPQAASPPNAALSFAYLFSDDNLKAWDRTTLSLSNDPMTNLPLPSKLATAGREALEQARAAGQRFESEKFRLQAEVLSLYLDLALHGELIRAQGERVALLSLRAGETRAGVQAGRRESEELLDAQTERDLAQDALTSLHAQLPSLVARMNALLARAADAPVPLPRALPEARALAAGDAQILQLASERSPELAALAHEVAGSEEALDLARKNWLPDINPLVAVTGSVSRTLGGMLVLPTRVEAIRAGIEEARAVLTAARAAREQYARDLAASFVLDLVVMHDAERQAALFAGTLVPRAELLVATRQNGYAAGRGTLAELVEARLALVDARLTLAELRVEREKALAALENSVALDVESLHAVRLGM